MKKITTTILAIVLVAMGTILVIGQTNEKPVDGKKFGKNSSGKHFGRRHGKRGKRGNKMRRLFRQLNLSESQKAQMKAIRKASRQDTKELRQQMRTNRQQLRQLTENGQFDEAAVTAIATQQGQIHAQMIVAKQRTKAEMYNVLTTEQKSQLTQLKAELKQRMQERKARWAERKAVRQAAKEQQE